MLMEDVAVEAPTVPEVLPGDWQHALNALVSAPSALLALPAVPAALGMDPGRASEVLVELQDAGLVEVTASELVSLTPSPPNASGLSWSSSAATATTRPPIAGRPGA